MFGFQDGGFILWFQCGRFMLWFQCVSTGLVFSAAHSVGVCRGLILNTNIKWEQVLV